MRPESTWPVMKSCSRSTLGTSGADWLRGYYRTTTSIGRYHHYCRLEAQHAALEEGVVSVRCSHVSELQPTSSSEQLLCTRPYRLRHSSVTSTKRMCWLTSSHTYA